MSGYARAPVGSKQDSTLSRSVCDTSVLMTRSFRSSCRNISAACAVATPTTLVTADCFFAASSIRHAPECAPQRAPAPHLGSSHATPGHFPGHLTTEDLAQKKLDVANPTTQVLFVTCCSRSCRSAAQATRISRSSARAASCLRHMRCSSAVAWLACVCKALSMVIIVRSWRASVLGTERRITTLMVPHGSAVDWESCIIVQHSSL